MVTAKKVSKPAAKKTGASRLPPADPDLDRRIGDLTIREFMRIATIASEQSKLPVVLREADFEAIAKRAVTMMREGD